MIYLTSIPPFAIYIPSSIFHPSFTRLPETFIFIRYYLAIFVLKDEITCI